MDNPKVSIIVPTYNASEFISRCLKAISEQTYKNIEVIVVDQMSTDGTVEASNKNGAKVIMREKPKFYSPPAKSRNIGAAQAKGEILYHLDSDMYISRELIAEAVAKFKENNSIGALIVHEVDLFEGFWSKCKAFERKTYWGNDEIESARIVLRSVFENVGGYNEQISSGEDFDIHNRYKSVTNIGYCSNTTLHDLKRLSLKKTLVKKYNYGKTAKEYFGASGDSGKRIIMSELHSYARNYKAFIRHPILGIGTLTLRSLEIAAGVAGIISAKLRPR